MHCAEKGQQSYGMWACKHHAIPQKTTPLRGVETCEPGENTIF